MASVRIVTDSACDLTAEEAGALDIEIVPLSIRFGSDEYVDRVELSAEQFYEKMGQVDVLPETAAPSPGAFEAAFRRQAEAGADAVVCIDLSSKLSATIESARNAARALEGELDVRVVDSLSITSGLGTQVVEAAELARRGGGVDEVVALVESLAPRTRVFGALNTLDNLKKGGRIGGAQAMIGGLLNIKPVIDISSGEVHEAGKPRTRKRALAELAARVKAAGQVERLCVLHGMATDVDEMLDLLADAAPRDEIRVGLIGAVIGTHGGPGVMGVTWLDPA
jgi:DegV family protein with EDD domain